MSTPSATSGPERASFTQAVVNVSAAAAAAAEVSGIPPEGTVAAVASAVLSGSSPSSSSASPVRNSLLQPAPEGTVVHLSAAGAPAPGGSGSDDSAETRLADLHRRSPSMVSNQPCELNVRGVPYVYSGLSTDEFVRRYKDLGGYTATDRFTAGPSFLTADGNRHVPSDNGQAVNKPFITEKLVLSNYGRLYYEETGPQTVRERTFLSTIGEWAMQTFLVSPSELKSKGAKNYFITEGFNLDALRRWSMPAYSFVDGLALALESGLAVGRMGLGVACITGEFFAKGAAFLEEQVEKVDDDSPLVEACEEAGVPFACTEGICGTCVIEVVEGMENLSPFTQEEKDFLGEPGKERLACQCRLKGGCVKLMF